MKTNGINTNLLKAKMAEKGMKQYEVAPLLEISLPTLNRIVLGKSSPTLEVIQKIANLLELSPDDFTAIFYNKKNLLP